MHDEFLHRLRKEPRPEFAARLQARLRRQSRSLLPPPAPSRVRTLLTLLLIGGTSFAVTAVVMRGFPTSLLDACHYAAAWIRAERSSTPAGQVANQGFRRGWGWGASGSGSPHGAALRSGSAHAAASATSAQAAGTGSAASPGGSRSVGAGGFQIPQIRAMTSWAAYPYVATIAAQLNMPRGTRMPNEFVMPHMDVSVQDSDVWPGPICGSGANAPDVAYVFQAAETVSDRPCAPDSSGHPRPVMAIAIGHEILVLARSPLYGELDLTRSQIFLALAKWVPDPARPGAVRQNASTTWRQINGALGAEPLEFMGPPLSSAAGRSMIELLMEGGCNTYSWIAALKSTNPARYARICRTVRTDGVYAEVSGLDYSRLLAEPNAVGIFGSPWMFGWEQLSELPQVNGLVVSKLDGIEPSRQGIASGAYPGSRVLYLYVNRRRIAPNVVLNLLNPGSWPYPDWALLPLSPQQSRAAYDEAMGP